MKRRFFFRNIALSTAGLYFFPAFSNTGEYFAGQLTDDMEKLFVNPPDSCKPRVMWYLMNGHVTKEGITLDLEFLKRTGFGGAFCSLMDSGIPSGRVKSGSKKWFDVMKHSTREAERLGLELVFQQLPDIQMESPVSGASPAIQDFTETVEGKESYSVLPTSSHRSDSPAQLKFNSDVLFSMGARSLIFSPFFHQPYLTGVPGMSSIFAGLALSRNNTWSEGLSGLTNYLSRAQFLLQHESTAGDFTFSSRYEDSEIRFSHRKTGDYHIYFLVNYRKRTERIHCSFPNHHLKPEIWNCENGEIISAPIYSIYNDRLRMPLEIPPSGSVFIIFRKKYELALFRKITKDGNLIMDNEPLKLNGSTIIAEVHDQSTPIVPAIESDFPLSFHSHQDGSLKGLFQQNGVYNFLTSNESAEENLTVYVENCFSVRLDSSWVIHFPEGSGAPRELAIDKLESLTRFSDFNTRHFSGTCIYNTLFYLADSDFISGRKFLLDLGSVEIMARILMNGKDAGLLWKKPFIADITSLVKTGENILKVEVTNSWHNRLAGDENLPPENDYNHDGTIVKLPEWYIKNQPKPGERTTFTVSKVVTKDDPLVDSGLLGPVRLIFCEERFFYHNE